MQEEKDKKEKKEEEAKGRLERLLESEKSRFGIAVALCSISVLAAPIIFYLLGKYLKSIKKEKEGKEKEKE